ncbi:YqgQ family protein [Lactococcus nasutitermitis]|uniref:YqgQ family protein n=1 Tax=Lactococcus nasutitermitis TaxID=1652957 RepID=A0ABV9JBJ4_9LACT|nr:YqgQ family protein [Lactococcus nasutitermitis]
MKTLYGVQEWLKQYGYINLMSNRLDAIYFMQKELSYMVENKILDKSNHDYLTARLILQREERIEKEQLGEKF